VLLSDELGSRVTDVGASELTSVSLDELVRSGDSPLAHSLRRRRHEMDHPDIVVASHDSSID
jgi:hypothetical protein